MPVRVVSDASWSPDVLGPEAKAVVAFLGRASTPCRAYGAVLERVLRAAPTNVRLLCLNIEDSPLTARRYDISVLPTILVFQGGVLRDRLVGTRPAEDLWHELSRHLT